MKRKPFYFLLLLVLVTSIAIASIWTQMIPEYRARGEVLIRPIIPRLVFRTDDNGAIPFYEGFVNTQVAIMRSPQVLNRVLDQPDVRQTKWFREPKKSLEQRLTGQMETPMERLRNALSVGPRRNTEIMDVSFTCRSAQDASIVVNAVLGQYMKYVNDTASGQKDEEDRARDALYTRLRTEITDLETIINGFHQKLGTATPQELISARRMRLDETEARIGELTRTIALLEAQIGQSSTSDSDEAVTAVPMQPPYDQDPEWRTLNENLAALKHQIAASALKPQHPDMIRMTKDLEFAIESLRLREMRLDEQWTNQYRESAPVVPPTPSAPGLATLMTPQQQLAQAKREKKLLEEQYQQDKRDFEKLFEIAQELERYNTQLRQKREVFDQVRQIREQKQIEGGVAGSIRVLTRAYPPSKPHDDRRIRYTGIALGLCLVIGSGTVYLYHTPGDSAGSRR